MSSASDSSPTLLRCPRCGRPYTADLAACPECGYTFRVTPLPRTRNLDHGPTIPSHLGQRRTEVGPHHLVMLQSLPSGLCFSLDASTPVILGRGASPDARAMLDLSQLKAYEHGVSRAHCLIQTHDTSLLVMDLGSHNGTYLNDAPMTPLQKYELAHGDRLILGTLHLLVFFE